MLTELEKNKINELSKQGFSISKISRELNISRPTVNKYLLPVGKKVVLRAIDDSNSVLCSALDQLNRYEENEIIEAEILDKFESITQKQLELSNEDKEELIQCGYQRGYQKGIADAKKQFQLNLEFEKQVAFEDGCKTQFEHDKYRHRCAYCGLPLDVDMLAIPCQNCYSHGAKLQLKQYINNIYSQ